ncbi:MAG TPA: amidase [Burkholderiales bacterium]|jgi:aspartyl-tRNA(Asn)/glutamyl-tRNA(Gln) amidotransferase subunit A|nr:amidase [Burkholderiales bacterium]
MWTVDALSRDLAVGRTTSRQLVEEALARIADPAGEGARAFLKVYAEQAREEAEHSDRLRRRGVVRSPIEGLPISLKDLYDVAGDVTRAGSKLLAGAPPAKQDAPAVARLRAGGAVIIGRTNMVEFAFGTTGLNPHYGTPKNPWDRKTGRVPGGSSSGAAVAQADGMCVMALGSDTRGSIRQPAALCGVVGWKPTQRRVPLEGAFPLSYTLDTVGPLANSVACCVAYDAILSGEAGLPLALPAKGLRLLLPRAGILDDLDPEVGRAFEAALGKLSAAGASITEVRVPAFDRQAEYFKNGGFAGAEAYAIHRRWQDRLGEYDPRIAKRVLLGKEIAVADYIELGRLRAAYMREVEALAAPYDAMLMPTTPTIAPPIAEVDKSDEDYFRWNFRILRNVGIVNFLDGCAVSVPCHAPGTAPVGLSVFGVAMADRHVLAAAAAIEGVLRGRG